MPPPVTNLSAPFSSTSTVIPVSIYCRGKVRKVPQENKRPPGLILRPCYVLAHALRGPLSAGPPPNGLERSRMHERLHNGEPNAAKLDLLGRFPQAARSH